MSSATEATRYELEDLFGKYIAHFKPNCRATFFFRPRPGDQLVVVSSQTLVLDVCDDPNYYLLWPSLNALIAAFGINGEQARRIRQYVFDAHADDERSLTPRRSITLCFSNAELMSAISGDKVWFRKPVPRSVEVDKSDKANDAQKVLQTA